jgi:coenzyme F420-reducing hydrogenase gamma subunit
MLDQGKRFLDFMAKCDVGEFRLVEDLPMKDQEQYDICFVEGNPVTSENIKLLTEMRAHSKMLVVIGNCAALGGVWELKNYGNKQKTIKEVYKKMKVANPDIKEVDNFVKVDLTIPGCPIDGDEFMEIANQLLAGRTPKIPQSPVCLECQKNGYECLLQKGEVCLGPITLAGCKAVCLKSKQACWGCRGLLAGGQVENFMKHLSKKFTKDQIYRTMEVFGAKDSILAELKLEEKKKK